MKVKMHPIFFLSLLLLGLNAAAQKKLNYEQTFYTIDSLGLDQEAKKALVLINQVNEQARKDGHTAMIVKSVMYRMLFQNYLDPSTQAKLIDVLRQDVFSAKQPEKSILQSLLAESYWNYYQQNKYIISARTFVSSDIGDNIETWSIQKVTTELQQNYLASVSEKKLLQSTSLDLIKDVLVGDTATRYLRPTLYDLLAHRAIDVFMNTQTSVATPDLDYEIFNESLQSDVHSFMARPDSTYDRRSFGQNSLHILKELLEFHSRSGNKAAFAQADFKRLKFSFQMSRDDNKIQQYLRSLEGLLPNAKDTEIYSDILYEQAWIYVNSPPPGDKANNIKAIALIEEAIRTCPGSSGAVNAEQLAKVVKKPELSIEMKSNINPDEPFQTLIQYKNIKSAYFWLYKVSANDSEIESATHDKTRYFELINNNKLIKTFQKDLPEHKDYLVHTFGDYFEALPVGKYVLLAQDKRTFDTLGKSMLNSINVFTVTDLAVNFRTLAWNDHQYLLRSNKSGKPLKNVKIEEIIIRPYSREVIPGPVFLTNEEGYANSDTVQYVRRARLTLERDTLLIHTAGRYNQNVTDQRDVLFTDRPIYRPGQTVFYKGLSLVSSDGKNNIKPNEKVYIVFRDPSSKILKRDTLTTNEFGTFHGSFEIPIGKLNGSFRISSGQGQIDVQVEEYKRPTFEVLFDDAKEKYKLSENILVKGKATGFSGYQIGRAMVKYTVHRARDNYQRDYSEEEIKLVANGSSNTLENGTFTIKFFPVTNEKTKRHYYKYIVKAEITSQSGETRVAEKIIAVGEKDVKIVLNSIEFFHLDEKRDTIHAAIQNLNGQPIAANVKIDWFLLQAPDRLAHKWGLQKTPENYRLSREEFMKMFPNHEYGNENSPSAWPASPTAVFTQKFRTEDGNAPIVLTKQDLRPGYYRFIITAENIDKDTLAMESIVRIYDDEPTSIWTMQDWLICQNLTINKKEDAVFQIAGMKPESKAYYEVYYKDEVTERVWIDVSPIQRVIKITPKSHYENAFAVQFSMVHDGVSYNALQTINIEDKSKELDIKFLSFRDKLQPGEQETWKIKISNKAGEKQMAEMAATLYDASLDALKSMEWRQIRAGFYYGGFAWIHLEKNISHSHPLQLSVFKYEYFKNIVRQYERLNTFSLPYSGTRTNAFSVYLNAADNQLLIRDSIQMVRKLTSLRNGKKVYGIVRDHHGFVIADAPIYVNMKKQGNSDRLGIYEINAKAGDVIAIQVAAHLPFSYKLKPNQQRVDIILKALKNDLAEVVIRGYQKRTREQTTGSSYIVGGTGAPGMRSSVNTQGVSNIADQTVLLQGRVAGIQVVEDTKVYDFVSINSYDPKTGTYIINGKQVRHFNKIVTRKNFNETAFFFPQLRTNSAGEIVIEFTLPQTLTRFKMLGFAHTKNMINTVVSRELVTQKQFAISAQPPRFFRERDTIWMTATLNNLSGRKLKGLAIIELSDALSGKVIQSMVTGTGRMEGQKFDLANKDSQVLKWPLVIPSGISAITYKVMAQSGKYSDGEEMTIPVLPNSMLVTETVPLNVRGNSSKTFTMDKLLHSGSSSTLRHHSYNLEFTSNPIWYAIQALPYLMEYPYECAEQTFSRFYANSFATAIINSSPKITEVFKQWKEGTGGQMMLSNLEKNQELKSILLEETPWVRNAVNESERKKRLGVLFDLDKMSGELKRNFDKLEQMQFPNGSFPWFNGMLEDRYITQHIVLGMSQLRHLKVVDEKSYPNFNIMLNRAIIYLDGKFSNEYTLQTQGKRIDYLPLHYLYARSYSKHINTEKTFNTAFNYYIKKLMQEWGSMRLYEQGLAALVLHRNGNKQEAMMILKSLRERAQISEEMGMFWPENTDGWWWYQRSVETQALMVEVFDEVANDLHAVEELKIWLLKNKQTTDWKTTKATTAACYALLMRGYKLLEETAEPELLIGDKTIAQLGMEEPQKEAGTGYRKVIVAGSLVTPEMAKVSIKNNNKGIAWGGVYWQYFEQLDKLTPAETGIKIKKQLFLQEQTSNGPVLNPLTATRTLKSGDLLKVRIEIYSDRDMEYIHLRDMRSSGFEPVNVISTYKYQDGLGYYESTKDASTNFFISYMKKGTYVFEYPLRVSHAGNFSNGITTLQSMYAPEFSTHSEGIRTNVQP